MFSLAYYTCLSINGGGLPCRRLFRPTDPGGASVRQSTEILMCSADMCTNGLVNTYERNILSFGEDFDGLCSPISTWWKLNTSTVVKY